MSSETTNDELDRERNEVRAAFHAAAFDDEPPPEVDAVVLAAARNAVKSRFRGYLPPLALAATVVLALGLVLRLAIPTRAPVAISDSPEVGLAPRALESEAGTAETELGRADAARERAAVPATAPAADATGPARATAPEPDAAREEIVLNSRARQAPSARSAQRAATETMSAAPDDCGARFGEDPDGWLGCISALLDAGDEAAARRELAAFTTRFPNRVVPETIAARFAP